MSAFEIGMLVQAAATAADTLKHGYRLEPGNVFLVFFIMLGPLKSLGPFFAATRELDQNALRKLAWKVFALAVVAVLLAGLLGSSILRKWQITTPTMELAAGLVFLLVALRMVLAQYDPASSQSPAGGPQLMHLVFPITVTPYGVAALITMMAISADTTRSTVVVGLALVVMVLDLLAMLFVRPILNTIGPVPLQVLGAVLGILQVALALQIMHRALVGLGYAGGVG